MKMFSKILAVLALAGVLLVGKGDSEETEKGNSYFDYDFQDSSGNGIIGFPKGSEPPAIDPTDAPGDSGVFPLSFDEASLSSTPPSGPSPLIIVPKPGDPGNCNGKQCSEFEICSFDFASDSYFSCLWTFRHFNGTVSNQTIPGQCDKITRPPAFGADGSVYSCLVNQVALESGSEYRCVCTKGKCPKEQLKICEADHLLLLSNILIGKLIDEGDTVNIGDACNYTLEQQLPEVLEEYEMHTNFYKVVNFLSEATDRERSQLPLCNRRRMLSCKGDKCDCADGTEQREVQAGSRKYYSYYCYATSGACDRKPMDVMPQFHQMETKLNNHYGSPSLQGHRDPKTGCLHNLCKNVKGNKCSA